MMSNQLKPGVYRFSVGADSSGQCLDLFLAGCSDGFSRSIAKRLVNLGGVHLSGRRIRHCSQTVAVGESVEVFVDAQPLEPQPLDDSQLLYRDQCLIVLNKPSGMATQPTPARYKGTIYSELQKLLSDQSRRCVNPSIGMVQRLDRDTSGVMVFSIHSRGHKALTEAFRNHQVDKRYWALVAGRPDEESGAFCSLLAKRRSTNRTVSVERGGKHAETRYKVLQTNDVATLVEVELLTGRTHQIRAHFSEAGLPLLGDTFYGGPDTILGLPVPRQMLHARDLVFDHPATHEPLSFRAPLPDDFCVVLQHLFGDSVELSAL